MTGDSQSSDFPTTPGALQTKLPSPSATAYVAKIAATGASLVYATFLGGSEGSSGSAIRVDSQGDAIVLGGAQANFPITPGAFQPTGPTAAWDLPGSAGAAFLSKLNPTGSALVYSTYIDGGRALDVDSAGNAYVLGAASNGFPTTAGAYQSCNHGGGSDLFAGEFASDGTLSGNPARLGGPARAV